MLADHVHSFLIRWMHAHDGPSICTVFWWRCSACSIDGTWDLQMNALKSNIISLMYVQRHSRRDQPMLVLFRGYDCRARSHVNQSNNWIPQLHNITWRVSSLFIVNMCRCVVSSMRKHANFHIAFAEQTLSRSPNLARGIYGACCFKMLNRSHRDRTDTGLLTDRRAYRFCKKLSRHRKYASFSRKKHVATLYLKLQTKYKWSTATSSGRRICIISSGVQGHLQVAWS